jgi:glutamate-1-semialdehyde 2,1-aminomutase
VRFAASGSEATDFAVRAARAFTGKDTIIKCEGAYHGTHDIGKLSMLPTESLAGPVASPLTVPGPGMSINAAEGIITIPYNNPEVAEKIIKEHADEVAALIVEPMMVSIGCIPPQPGYLADLRRITAENDVLLIMDEVITSRFALGGFQEYAGVTGDLTALGKVIGGGLGIGAVGGRGDIMSVFDPANENCVNNTATFGGNPLSCAAGYAAMTHLTAEGIDRINTMGDQLKERFNGLFQKYGLRMQATGIGSILQIHFTDQALTNPRASIEAFKQMGEYAEQGLANLLNLSLRQRGIYCLPRQQYCISMAMTDADIENTVGVLGETLEGLLPLIESDYWHLRKKELNT